jgi:galactitol-specific phosphotransferase system IIB component
MLTSPKLKDLVNKPREKYDTIYNSLKSTGSAVSAGSSGDRGLQNLGEDSKNNYGSIDNSNSSSMKDELKKYLKELNITNNASDTNSNDLKSNNENTHIINSHNDTTNNIYPPNNIMTSVGANGISTRVNNMPNYAPNLNTNNTNNSHVAPDYGTPSMSSSYASAYSSY